MSRFYFHIYDSKQLIDGEGTELIDLDAARRHAVKYAAQLISDHPENLWTDDKWSMEVTNEKGFLYFRLDISATECRKLAS